MASLQPSNEERMLTQRCIIKYVSGELPALTTHRCCCLTYVACFLPNWLYLDHYMHKLLLNIGPVLCVYLFTPMLESWIHM